MRIKVFSLYLFQHGIRAKGKDETAYTKMIEKLCEIDPGGIVLAFADMMRKQHGVGFK